MVDAKPYQLDLYKPQVDNWLMKTLTERIATYGNNRMASELKVSPQAVSKWAKLGVIPPRRVLAVATLLDATPQSLSPEVFGPDVSPTLATPTKETP